MQSSQMFYQSNGNHINQRETLSNNMNNSNSAALLTSLTGHNGLLNSPFSYEYNPSYRSQNCCPSTNNLCTASNALNTPITALSMCNTSSNTSFTSDTSNVSNLSNPITQSCQYSNFDFGSNINTAYDSINVNKQRISNNYSSNNAFDNCAKQPQRAVYSSNVNSDNISNFPYNSVNNTYCNSNINGMNGGNLRPNNYNTQNHLSQNTIFGVSVTNVLNCNNCKHSNNSFSNQSHTVSSTNATLPCIATTAMSLFPPQINDQISSVMDKKPFNKTLDIDQEIPKLDFNSTATIVPKTDTKTPKTESEIRFDCHECGKRFKHKSNLKIHKIVHTDSALKCNFCQKKFARKGNLKQHLRVHTDERPYKCCFCPKRFKQPHSLKDHLRIHTGEKPFLCEFCGKSFNVKHNMVIHRRLHTGEKPFDCNVCAKKFASKSSLNGHTKKFHPSLWEHKHFNCYGK